MKTLLYTTTAFVLCGGIVQANAACIATPSCTAMGYTSTSSCTNGIKCPFGNYWNCANSDLSNKITELENKINSGAGTDPSDKTYDCKIGDIFYSDWTCSTEVVSGKTPIAVVVYKSGNCAQALALAQSTTGKWAQKRTTLVTSLPYVEDWDAAAADVGSCANSKKLLAEGDATKFPAVWAAHNYSTAGTKVGDWCLPAAGIFTSYYNEQNAVNAGLARANGVPITEHEYNKTWSSTLWDEYSAWLGYFYQNYGLRYESKDDVFLVRPVLEF